MKVSNKAPLPHIPETSWGSKFYWLGRNILGGIKQFALRHKFKFFLFLIVLLTVLFISRALWQPFLIMVRLHLAPVIAMLAGLLLGSAIVSRKKYLWGTIIMVVSVALGILAFPYHSGIRQYLSLWYHYGSHPQEELEKLPITRYERIHPRNAVQTLAREGISDVHEVSAPEFVRDGKDYVWTMAIEPAFAVRRLTGDVGEVIRVPADKVALNFSGENKFPKVEFFTGEGMLGGPQYSHCSDQQISARGVFSTTSPFKCAISAMIKTASGCRWCLWSAGKASFYRDRFLAESSSFRKGKGIDKVLQITGAVGTGKWISTGSDHPNTNSWLEPKCDPRERCRVSPRRATDSAMGFSRRCRDIIVETSAFPICPATTTTSLLPVILKSEKNRVCITILRWSPFRKTNRD